MFCFSVMVYQGKENRKELLFFGQGRGGKGGLKFTSRGLCRQILRAAFEASCEGISTAEQGRREVG